MTFNTSISTLVFNRANFSYFSPSSEFLSPSSMLSTFFNNVFFFHPRKSKSRNRHCVMLTELNGKRRWEERTRRNDLVAGLKLKERKSFCFFEERRKLLIFFSHTQKKLMLIAFAHFNGENIWIKEFASLKIDKPSQSTTCWMVEVSSWASPLLASGKMSDSQKLNANASDCWSVRNIFFQKRAISVLAGFTINSLDGSTHSLLWLLL